MYIGQDERNSSRYLLHLYQGGIRLPDRDYYFEGDSSTNHIRAEYQKHVPAMLQLLGEGAATAKQSGQTIMRIETALARRSRTLE